MDNESEVIRQQMEDTRTSLTDKLEALEQQVVGTVQSATSAVTDTVENVKEAVQDSVASVRESVQETVETVKDTFDVHRLVDRHPWVTLGGSVALGFLAGRLLSRFSGDQPWGFGERSGFTAAASHQPSAAPTSGARAQPFTGETVARGTTPEPSEPGLFSELADRFAPEISKLKGMAIGTLLGVVRDMITEAAPERMKTQLTDVADSLTTKLGGEPVRGPVLHSSSESSCGTEGEYRAGRSAWSA